MSQRMSQQRGSWNRIDTEPHPPTPHHYTSSLVQTCMTSLACVLPVAFIQQFEKDLFTIRTEEATEAATVVDEWVTFTQMIKYLAGGLEAQQLKLNSNTNRSVTGDAAWTQLLASRYHQVQSKQQTGCLQMPTTPNQAATISSTDQFDRAKFNRLQIAGSTFLPHLPHIFLCLHLVYEDLKLPQLNSNSYALLACEILKPLAILLGQLEYLDLYGRELYSKGCWSITPAEGQLWQKCLNQLPASAINLIPRQPPSIHAFLLQRLRAPQDATIYPLPSNLAPDNSLTAPFGWTRKLLRFYDLLTKGTPSTPTTSTSSQFLSSTTAESVVLAMVDESFTLDHLSLLPFGLSLPLLECLKQVREHPPVHLTQAMNGQTSTNATTAANWPREAYLLIGREDLGRMFSSVSATHNNHAPAHRDPTDLNSIADPYAWSNDEQSTDLDRELEIVAGNPGEVELELGSSASAAAAGASSSSSSSRFEESDLDGTLCIQRDASLRFGLDLRLKEVRHLLRSDRVVCVSLDASIKREIECGSGEASIENQVRLGIVIKRSLSLPIARGMYTLASIVPILTESLPIPPLVLRGRLPPLNTVFELDLTPGNVTGMSPQTLQWPEFHNGVAAALRVQPPPANNRTGANEKEEMRSKSSSSTDLHASDLDSSPDATTASLHQVTRTWIVYNRPTSQSTPTNPSQPSSSTPATKSSVSYAHAGFLFGLGLTGHLNCLTANDFFWYLSQNHEPTAVAMLLGMAACRRGSMDTVVSKMLTLHIPALLPPNISEMNIPSLIQSSALLGLGLLYQGSCHRLMAEILLNEIGRRPDRFKSDESFLTERENYSLSAGLGLGLLLLGRGGDATHMSALSDLNVEKKLSLYIHGGKDTSGSGVGGSGGASDGSGGINSSDDVVGGVGWMNDASTHRTRHTNDSTAGASNAATRSTSNQIQASASAKNGRIKEGRNVNIDVTSPGATLALGLMYLQTNNALMSARLTIPDTHYSLDYVRADFIFLRVLAKHLIMWDTIPQTSQQVLDTYVTDLHTTYVLSLRYYMTGSTASIDNAFESHVGAADEFTRPQQLPKCSLSSDSNDDIDYSTLRQNYLYIISANCFAMGLKFAGTCDPTIVRILLRILHAFRQLGKKRDFIQLITMEGLNPAAQLHKVDRGTLDAVMIGVTTALSLVMCGSGNLMIFKLFRSLYKIRPDKLTPAGWYTSISMCIGFLFLGGGRLTLDTSSSNPNSQSNIAYLVIALYPHLASTVDDQRYYLQVYRHLYVLSTIQRGLQTIDVDTGASCYVPLEVIVQTNPSTAALIPNQTHSKRLRLITPCLLPAYDSIQSITIVSPRFHALSLDLRTTSSITALIPHSATSSALTQFQRLYVKKKIGYESYEKDPKGLRSIMARTVPQNHALVVAALGDDMAYSLHGSHRTEFLTSFSTDPRLLSFTQLFIREHGYDVDTSGRALLDYLSDVLYECLQEEKFFQMIQIYLYLFPVAHQPTSNDHDDKNSSHLLESKLCDAHFISDLVLLKQYYRTVRSQTNKSSAKPTTSTNTTRSGVGRRIPINHSTPFHTLPLGEGSAQIELDDLDRQPTTTNTHLTHALIQPLLSIAFLDTIFLRVDQFLLQHHPLQQAFMQYIQAAAQPQLPDMNALQTIHLQQPLLGSLLACWEIPHLTQLYMGLLTFKQTIQEAAAVKNPSPIPSPLHTILLGLIWPHLSAVPIQSILKALRMG